MLAGLKNLFAPRKAKAAFSGIGVVFMADTRGVTRLSESISPEEIVDHLNRSASTLIAAVEQRGGVVHQHVGGSVVAYWPPSEMPEAIGRAVAAGLDVIRKREVEVIASVAVAGLALSSAAGRSLLIGPAYSRAEASLRLASVGCVAMDSDTLEALPAGLKDRITRKDSHAELR